MMKNRTYRTYKAYTRFGNEVTYGSYGRKNSKENKQDLSNELKRHYGKYISLKDVDYIERWNG